MTGEPKAPATRRPLFVEPVEHAPDSVVGKRITLIHTTDPHTRIESGTEGTVRFVDSLGTLHTEWDDGSTLGVIPGEDTYRLHQESERP